MGARAASPSATGCSRAARREKPLPTIGDDAAATIYLYISSILTAQAAEVVGDEALAAAHGERAETVKKAFAARVHHTVAAGSPMTTRPPMRWRSCTT